jgi:hypothetical protein
VNSETKLLLASRTAGPTTVVTPDGKTIITGGCEVRNVSTSLATGPEQPVDSANAPIQECVTRLKVLSESSAAYNYGIPFSSSFPNLFNGSLKPDTQCTYPVNDKNNEFYQACINKGITDLRAAEIKAERNRQINTCIEENLKSINRGSATVFDRLLNVILNQGLDLLLGQLNENLPEYAKVDFDISSDNKIRGLTVGPVSFDQEKQEVTIEGNVFSALVADGLDGFNQGMPDFLQLTASDLSLSLGDVSVSYEALFGVDPAEPSKVIPKTPQSLGSGVAVQVNTAGTVEVVKGQEVFSIGKVVSSVGAKVFSKGLSLANSSLPDYLQVSGNFPLSSRNGSLSYSNNNFSVGPVSYNAAADKIEVDTVGISNNLVGYAEELLLSNVSAPLGPLAQVFWRAINPAALLNQLLSGLAPSLVRDPVKDVYTRAKDSCTQQYSSVMPSASFLPANGTPSAVENEWGDFPPPVDSSLPPIA